ncbi:unnamed protein product [Somion occarium]|uniref:Heterokaryon incompatibility domain-containing protein n=1 Tax=Somion occarium TaxID=3059160 RepID=A0ABP1CRX0_9APHY
MQHIDDSIDKIRRRIARSYWNGKLRWKPREQLLKLVYGTEPRPEFIPFQVPYMCRNTPYDGLDFWNYPSRVGWKVNRHDNRCHEGRCPPGNCVESNANEGLSLPYGLHAPAVSRTDGSIAPVNEKVAFLQAWLFFGALTEVCSICGLVFDFHESLHSGDVVDTGALNGLPIKLYKSSQQLGLAGSMNLRRQLHTIMRHMQLITTRAHEVDDEHEYALAECEVLLSIHVLLRIICLSLLCHAPHWELGPTDGMHIPLVQPSPEWRSVPEGLARLGVLTLDRLAQRGWCKSDIHLMRDEDVFVFAPYLKRPGAALRDHTGCTETKIPKVIISDDLELSLVDDETLPYVAISHVWVDGLGNPFENALPRCQLQRLHHLVNILCNTYRLNPSRRRRVGIWIDTLCIPVAPHLKEYRKLAIRLLAQTFQQSIAVLALDRELCLFDSRKAPILELGIRVICSGWTKRLWTLQEAALAVEGWSSTAEGRLYVQMLDGPVLWRNLDQTFVYKRPKAYRLLPIPDPMLDTVDEVKTILLFEMWVKTSLNKRLPSVHDLQGSSWDAPLAAVSQAAHSRSTSKAEDEPICLASLLGLDLAKVLSVQSTSERMIQVYLLLRELPMAIIFAQRGVPNFRARNLEQAPFRWAPKLLSTLENPQYIRWQATGERTGPIFHRSDGICEPDGFHFQHRGLLITDLHEGALSRRYILEVMDNGQVQEYVLVWLGGVPERPPSDMAFIFENDIDAYVAMVCIEEKRQDGDGNIEYLATLIGYGLVSKMEERHRTKVKAKLRGILTSSEQKWCLT